MSIYILSATGRLEDVNRQTEEAIRSLRQLPYRDYLQTCHWRRTRALALERAGFQCALCQRGERLCVHHRSYARIGFEQPRDLIVLCGTCHEIHHERIVIAAVLASDRRLAQRTRRQRQSLTNNRLLQVQGA
jgi:hypothetical protein